MSSEVVTSISRIEKDFPEPQDIFGGAVVSLATAPLMHLSWDLLVSYPLPMTPILTWNLFVLGDKSRLLLKVETMAKLEKLKSLYCLRSPLLQSKPRCWSGSQRLFVLEGHEKAGALVQPWMVVRSGQQGREACIWEISYMSGSLMSSSGEHYETCSPHPGGDGGIWLRWLKETGMIVWMKVYWARVKKRMTLLFIILPRWATARCNSNDSWGWEKEKEIRSEERGRTGAIYASEWGPFAPENDFIIQLPHRDGKASGHCTSSLVYQVSLQYIDT